MKNKINVINKKEMKISFINAPQLFYSDKLVQVNDDVYLYTEPMDEYLHNRGIVLCAAVKINFGDAIYDVIVFDSALLKLPPYVQDMFIGHEVGHFVNNDISDLSEADARKLIIKRTFGIIPTMEFNADKYAASLIGVSSAKSALMFMVKNTNLPLNSKIELLRRYCKIK